MRLRPGPYVVTTGLMAISVLLLAGCGGGGQSAQRQQPLSGEIVIDGSSTVEPLSKAIAAMFEQDNPGVRVSVSASGSGGGFAKLCEDQIAIADASRAINEEERESCRQQGVRWEEIPVANDALTVVVNRENPLVCVSPEQLEAIYGSQATATTWNQVPDLATPFDQPLRIFSPGSDSGTFDNFTKLVLGTEGEQRSEDVTSVGEQDTATVVGVGDAPGGIGYLGYSYFRENQNKLKALQVRNSDGECVGPTPETAHDGSYNPLSRKLFIYPSAQALQRPEVRSFVDFYLDNVNTVAPRAGFITLTEPQLQEAKHKVDELTG